MVMPPLLSTPIGMSPGMGMAPAVSPPRSPGASHSLPMFNPGNMSPSVMPPPPFGLLGGFFPPAPLAPVAANLYTSDPSDPIDNLLWRQMRELGQDELSRVSIRRLGMGRY
eukprot:942809-Amphidinium_carterae.1